MNSELEKRLWGKVEKYVSLLNMVPFVEMIAVCNNLAFGKVDGKSDIDLFVITRRGRLFTARSFITFLLHICGVRRHGKKVAGRFCLSFFIDDSVMDLSPIAVRDDIYLAYWIKSMAPIIDKNYRVSGKFLRENHWARKYFKDEADFRIKADMVFSDGNSSLRRFFEWVFGGWFGSFIEGVLRRWQLKRALKKVKGKEGNRVTAHMLKFHDVDRRKEYRDKFYRKYGKGTFLTDEKFLSL